MSFRLVPKSVTLHDFERRNGVILRYFSKFRYLPGALRKSSRLLSHLLMSSCQELLWAEPRTTQQQSFYSPLSGTTWVNRCQKNHSPTHHPDHHPVFISGESLSIRPISIAFASPIMTKHDVIP